MQEEAFYDFDSSLSSEQIEQQKGEKLDTRNKPSKIKFFGLGF